MNTLSRRLLAAGALAASMCLGQAAPPKAQGQRIPTAPVQVPAVTQAEQADADRTRNEFRELLFHFPPALREVLALDSSLLSNPAYLEPYPGVSAFLAAHPEIARDPGYYVGEYRPDRFTRRTPMMEMWMNVLGGLAAFTGFGMAIGLLVWLVRKLIDYRRWSRLAKVQAEVHAKLLDRMGTNEELMAYIQSPAGSRFLESAPIPLDEGSRPLSAPLGRILWSVQGGVILMAGGIGLWMVSLRLGEEASLPLQSIGILALALGAGFIVSAIISYVLSRRLGLLEVPAEAGAVVEDR